MKLLAPRAGFEPATNRLTAGCSTTELPGNRAHANAAAYSRDFSLLQRSFESFFHSLCMKACDTFANLRELERRAISMHEKEDREMAMSRMICSRPQAGAHTEAGEAKG